MEEKNTLIFNIKTARIGVECPYCEAKNDLGKISGKELIRGFKYSEIRCGKCNKTVKLHYCSN